MKFSSTLFNLRKKYIHTNSVGFQHSTYLLIAFLREKTITQVVTSWEKNIQVGGSIIPRFIVFIHFDILVTTNGHVVQVGRHRSTKQRAIASYISAL